MSKSNQRFIPAGYCFRLESKQDWKSAKNDAWEITLGAEKLGKVLGHRYIDDAHCTVLRVDSRIYAIQDHYLY